MSYLIKGQWETDKDNRMLGHMTIILFPVLCKCHTLLNIAKTTIFNYQTIKLFSFFGFIDFFLLCLTSSKVSKKLTKIQDVRNFLIVLYYFVSWILQFSTFFKECVLRAKRASPPQELEFTGPEGPEILVKHST